MDTTIRYGAVALGLREDVQRRTARVVRLVQRVARHQDSGFIAIPWAAGNELTLDINCDQRDWPRLQIILPIVSEAADSRRWIDDENNWTRPTCTELFNDALQALQNIPNLEVS